MYPGRWPSSHQGGRETAGSGAYWPWVNVTKPSVICASWDNVPRWLPPLPEGRGFQPSPVGFPASPPVARPRGLSLRSYASSTGVSLLRRPGGEDVLGRVHVTVVGCAAGAPPLPDVQRHRVLLGVLGKEEVRERRLKVAKCLLKRHRRHLVEERRLGRFLPPGERGRRLHIGDLPAVLGVSTSPFFQCLRIEAVLVSPPYDLRHVPYSIARSVKNRPVVVNAANHLPLPCPEGVRFLTRLKAGLLGGI